MPYRKKNRRLLVFMNMCHYGSYLLLGKELFSIYNFVLRKDREVLIKGVSTNSRGFKLKRKRPEKQAKTGSLMNDYYSRGREVSAPISVEWKTFFLGLFFEKQSEFRIVVINFCSFSSVFFFFFRFVKEGVERVYTFWYPLNLLSSIRKKFYFTEDWRNWICKNSSFGFKMRFIYFLKTLGKSLTNLSTDSVSTICAAYAAKFTR